MRTALFFVCVLVSAATLQAGEKATLRVTVKDANDAPLPGAKLSVHLWTGQWEKTEVVATTDKQGAAQLAGIKSEQYLTVAAEADGFASTAQDMELGPGEQREISIRLRRPAKGTVRVLDSQDQPVPGAALSVLHFNAGDGGSLFYRPAGNEPFPFEPSFSNAQGIIQLPPMPDAANVELCVFHPDYLPKKVANLQAIDGELTTVKLAKGVELRFKFTLGAGLSKLPDNLRVTTSIDSFKVDEPRVTGLYLPMQLSQTDWHCHVLPAKYERLLVRSESDDITITPMIFADDGPFKSMLTVADSQPHEVDFLVRKNTKVRGKISGYLNGLGPNATAMGSTENLHPTLVQTDDKTHWVPITFPDIAKDGSFELSLPPGKAKVGFGGLVGAIIEPAEFEFKVEPGKETILPEFKILQLKNITGQLVDENHQPLVGALARLYVGVWGSEYVKTDSNGRFALSPDLIVETAQHHQSQLDASVIGLDPKSAKCAVLSISQDWRSAQDLVIRCEPRPKGWLLQKLGDQYQRVPNMQREYWNEQMQKRVSAFPKGTPGQMMPDISSGTWLNTKATSLKDFRGKYVLLDFWFIGCGPCEADLPQLKILQEVYGGDRFTVVSIHVTAQTVENVRQFAEQHKMTYPIVIDSDDGDIRKQLDPLGIEGFPSYILLGPDGRILQNDDLTSELSLRMFKLEKVMSELRN